MKIRARKYSGTLNPEITEQELKHRAVARKAGAEGIVLLKNEGVLPLAKEKPVALLGSGATRGVKGGTGSGDVNEREVVSIYQGFVNAGLTVTSKDWIEDYEKRFVRARYDWRDKLMAIRENSGPGARFFEIYSANKFVRPSGRPITIDDIGNTETTVYVISRTAGEGADRKTTPGDYYLTDAEKAELTAICELCQNVVVIVNAGSQIDMKDIISHPEVKGILFIAQAGMEGGNVVADILTGAVNPSGKLTDTWTYNYSDFPNADTFSHMSGEVTTEEYKEDIYVGYRYFDTFDVDVLYPFGFGLSYTRFEVEGNSVSNDGHSITVTAKVKNTGEKAGKEVVQVYVSCPQSGLRKERKRLCGYAKTKLLEPGEEQELSITFPVKGIASFDESKSAWVVEEGLYGVWTGTCVRDVELTGVLAVEETKAIEVVAHICPMQRDLETITPPSDANIAYEQAWQRASEEKGLIAVELTPMNAAKTELPYTDYDKAAEELVEKLPEDLLVSLCVGNVSRGQGSTIGAAGITVPGSAGETSGELEKDWGVPGVPMADGPAGLRLNKQYQVDKDTGEIYTVGMLATLEGGIFAEEEQHENTDTYYQYCTSLPVGVLLAQTWDPAVLEEVGKIVAEEMEMLGVAWWLAPGMNIHRNPLCGRNFEYFSEDPVISGTMAAAMTRGVQSAPGVGTTIKHFACNNQEDNRKGSNSIVTERALREIYLRGFEIAVKTSQPMCIMTSYNLINGVHTANSIDLCTVVAREEWGFNGIIMTDWTTTAVNGGSQSWQCVAVGNDLIEPGTYDDFENIHAALKDGRLSSEELKACAKRMLKVIFQTLCYEDAISYLEQFGEMPPYITVK